MSLSMLLRLLRPFPPIRTIQAYAIMETHSNFLCFVDVSDSMNIITCLRKITLILEPMSFT